MTALTMSGSKPTIVFGLSAALELNGGKSADVMTTYVLPLLAAADVVLLLAAAAVAELEPALELLLLLLPHAAIRTTAAAARAAKRRRVAIVLMWLLLSSPWYYDAAETEIPSGLSSPALHGLRSCGQLEIATRTSASARKAM